MVDTMCCNENTLGDIKQMRIPLGGTQTVIMAMTIALQMEIAGNIIELGWVVFQETMAGWYNRNI